MIIDQIENILAKYGYPISNVNWVYFWFGRQGIPTSIAKKLGFTGRIKPTT